MWSQSWGHSFTGSIWTWFLFCQNLVLTGEASNWDEEVSFSNPESPSLEAFSLNSAWKLCRSLFSSPLLMFFYGWCLKTHLWLSAFFLKASLGRPTASLGIPHIPDGASSLGIPHIPDGASSLGIPISQTEPHHWAFPISQTEPHHWAFPISQTEPHHWAFPMSQTEPHRWASHVPDGASLLASPADDGASPPACRSSFLNALPTFTNVPFAVPSAVSSTHSPDCCQHALSFCYGSTLFLIPDIVFSYLFCLIRPELSGLKQNYYLLKTLQPELDFLLIWLGIIHATTDIRRLNWGWPPKKSGVTGIDGGQLYIVALQADSPAEKLDLFTWCLRAPRDWEQKHPGLLESMQRAGTAALLRVPSVKASPRAREISFTCW